MSYSNLLLRLLIVVFSFTVTTGIFGFNKTKKGEGGTEVSGSAGAAGAQGASSDLVRCAQPIGTAALVEPDNPYYHQYGLTSPIPLVKMIMAQSGCFRVVDRGQANAAAQREKELARSGEFQKGSNMGQGQMAAADYLITPNITHKDKNAGGGFGGLGALLPGRLGAIAGGINIKKLESSVMLSVVNVRTSVQEAIATGSAKKSDIGIGGFLWAGSVAGGGGVYESTDIGKVTASAFLDAHNALVTQLGAIPVGNASVDNAGWRTAADVNFRSGPSTSAPVLAKLVKGTSVRATGQKNGNWWEIEAWGNTGWIHEDFLTR